MPLSPGDNLGPYEIVSLIGEGGMGEVYKGRDPRLNRTVAIKVAKTEFSQRFEHEARAVAALNHPNICQIYDVGPNYLVMEYVEGVPLPKLESTREVLDAAVQIAGGLAAAHAAGILHRDLKPGNILLRKDGQIKILDFGLAKSLNTRELDATVPDSVTTPGAIVGTISFMSPEQAQGKQLDLRSDQFSFGLILYKLLAGKSAFTAASHVELMTAIIQNVAAPLPATTPPPMRWLVERCLSKDPRQRYADTSDLHRELVSLRDHFAEWAATAASTPSEAQVPGAPAVPNRWLVIALLLGVLLVCAAATALWQLRKPAPFQSGPVITPLSADGGLTTTPVLSTDGKLVAYASDRAEGSNLDLWVQQLNGGDALQLTRDAADDYDPSFSPDGTRIAYRSDRAGGGIYSIPAIGGEERLIADRGRQPRYSPDGQWIAYWTGMLGGSLRDPRKLHVAPGAGGASREVETDLVSALNPVWSPDGSRLICIGVKMMEGKAVDDLWVVPLAGGPAMPAGFAQLSKPAQIASVANTLQLGAWLRGDRLVFSATHGGVNNLFAAPVSPNGQMRAPIERLTSGTSNELSPSAISIPGAGGKSTWKIATAAVTSQVNIWWLPLDSNRGKVTGEMHAVQQDTAQNYQPRISSSGRYLVFNSDRGGGREIRWRDMQTGRETTLTQGVNARASSPVLNADGSSVIYRDAKSDLMLASVNREGSPGSPQRLLEASGRFLIPDSWSVDGRWFLLAHGGPFLTALRLETRQTIEAARGAGKHLYSPNFSPDGRWITFAEASGPGHTDIWVAPFRGTPVPQSEWVPIVIGPGIEDKPDWSPGGGMIYFTSERDGTRCLWAQQLNPLTKHPVEKPFPVAHFHNARRSMQGVNAAVFKIRVAPDRIFFNQAENAGNIWLMTFPDR